MEANLDLIIDICKSYSEIGLHNVYLRGNIPEKKLQNAVEKFPLICKKSIIMFCDTSVFNNGKTGIAICDTGIFYINNGLIEPWLQRPIYKYFTWNEFSSLDIYSQDHNIFFGNNYNVVIALDKERKAIKELLRKIQLSLIYQDEEDENIEDITFLDPEQKISPRGNVWMLAINQKQYGPMDTTEIEEMISNNIFNPEITFAWKQGMDNWELFNNVPELKTIWEELNKNTIQPPPIPNINNTKPSLDSEKIDINNCRMEELLTIDGIDLQGANSLIEMRQKGKKFYTVEDIVSILNLKPHEVEELKNKIIFNLPKASSGGRRIDF